MFAALARRAPVEVAYRVRVGRADSRGLARVGADPLAGVGDAIVIFGGAGAAAGGATAAILGKSLGWILISSALGAVAVLAGAYAYFELGIGSRATPASHP